MSFHRVLPCPAALSNEDLTNRWAIGPDSLESARIMPNERSEAAFLTNSQIQASSSPQPTSRKLSTQVEKERSVEGTDPAGHSSDPRRQDSIPSPIHKPAPSSIDIWQGESPSQICLCQPDPKVPRPRNGMLDLKLESRRVSTLSVHLWLTQNFLQHSSFIDNTTKPT